MEPVKEAIYASITKVFGNGSFVQTFFPGQVQNPTAAARLQSLAEQRD